jgi:hypothetical protein
MTDHTRHAPSLSVSQITQMHPGRKLSRARTSSKMNFNLKASVPGLSRLSDAQQAKAIPQPEPMKVCVPVPTVSSKRVKGKALSRKRWASSVLFEFLLETSRECEKPWRRARHRVAGVDPATATQSRDLSETDREREVRADRGGLDGGAPSAESHSQVKS